MDNVNNPDTVCQITYTKLFNSQISGASGSDTAALGTTVFMRVASIFA